MQFHISLFCIIIGMSPYVCDCTNVVYMFCVYCIYNYVNKFEARSLFSTSHLNRYSEVIVTVNDETICCRMKSYISEHLENIIDEFRRYFPDVVNEDTLLI